MGPLVVSQKVSDWFEDSPYMVEMRLPAEALVPVHCITPPLYLQVKTPRNGSSALKQSKPSTVRFPGHLQCPWKRELWVLGSWLGGAGILFTLLRGW